MTSSLASLYPREAHELPTVVSMPIGRLPSTIKPGGRNLSTPREFYGPAILREIQVGDGDRLAFVEKAFPHSLYDLMILASDDEIRCSVTDLARDTKRLIFGLSAQFVDYLSDPDVVDRYGLARGHLNLAFNHDRYTADRENSMCCDKRFHLHLNYWSERELSALRPVSWGEIPDRGLRQRLLDPIAYLSEHVLWDRLGGQLPNFPMMPVDPERDRRLGLPAGPKVRFSDWGFLRDGGLVDTLDALHHAADAAYRELYKAVTGEDHQPLVWERPTLLPIPQRLANLERIAWLSAPSLAGLRTLAQSLRDVTADDMQRFRESANEATARLSLAGLDYAITLFAQQRNTVSVPLAETGPVYLVMHCKLFGDIGGAGLPSVDRIPVVRLDRAQGSLLTDEQIESRRQFRNEFLDGALPAMSETFDLRTAH